MSDQANQNRAFGITVTSKMRHAALWKACQECGSVRKLAMMLKVPYQLMINWVNLRNVPSFLKTRVSKRHWLTKARTYKSWPQDRIKKLEEDLYSLTGQTLDELFPVELCANEEFLNAKKIIEQTKEFTPAMLGHVRNNRLLLPSPADEVAEAEQKRFQKRDINRVLKTLTYREREIIRLRYGLGDGKPHTLEEVGHLFNVTRETIRIKEARAIRKLQKPAIANELLRCID